MKKYKIIINCIEENRTIANIAISCSLPVFKSVVLALLAIYPEDQGYEFKVYDIHEASMDIIKLIAHK